MSAVMTDPWDMLQTHALFWCLQVQLYDKDVDTDVSRKTTNEDIACRNCTQHDMIAQHKLLVDALDHTNIAGQLEQHMVDTDLHDTLTGMYDQLVNMQEVFHNEHRSF
jgi:hypothetical protein